MVDYSSVSNGNLEDGLHAQNGNIGANGYMAGPDTEVDTSSTDKTVGVRLQRNVGLVSGTTLIVGTIIGSGIFVSPKGILEGSGSVGMTILLWAACGALSTMGALVYAELGTAVPRSGGEHAYLMYTFNKEEEDEKKKSQADQKKKTQNASSLTHTQNGFTNDQTHFNDQDKQGLINGEAEVVGHRPGHSSGPSAGRLPAFLYDWLALLIIRPTMFAIMSLSLGTYAVQPFYGQCPPPPIVVKLVTAAAICLIAFVNCASVKAATRVQNITTFTKVGALAIIALGGIVQICRGHTENFDEPFADTTSSPGIIAIAFYNGLWAFDGWNSLNFVTEELKNPSRNLPLAIMIGIPLVTVCYVMANIGYLAIMSKAEILQSHAVAVRWGELMMGQYMTWLMPCFVIISTFGSANGCLFASGRLSYAAGRDGHFPKVLSFIDMRRLTPVPAVLFTAVISICLIVPSDLGLLIDIFIFSSWLFYGWTTLTLLILRYKEPDLPRPYKVPLVVPVLVLLACAYLLVAPFVQNPGGSGAFTMLILLVGLLAYVPFVHMRLAPPGMEQVTTLLQKIFCIVPGKDD